MTVKILSSSKTFNGVRYNTNKMETAKGELMRIENFGMLEGLANLRPEDYINYLKMISAQNKAISSPQFHAVISCKNREHDKVALTAIAVKWLKEMGYEKQPYLIIFHKDTNNNHVHIVSTRIDKQGKTISNSFEKNRAVHAVNKIMGLDEKLGAKQDLERALNYRFSTKAQFMMLLELKGYTLKAEGEQMQVIKYGRVQESVPISQIENKIISLEKDNNRSTQIRAIIEKYKKSYSPLLELKPVHSKAASKSKAIYTSSLAGYLKDNMGLELLFHASGDKEPYGYTVIDHAGKNVFKGSDILPLKELLIKDLNKDERMPVPPTNPEPLEIQDLSLHQRNYYSTLVRAALNDYPDFAQGLDEQGLMLIKSNDGTFLKDKLSGITMNLEPLLNAEELATSNAHSLIDNPIPANFDSSPTISLSLSIDQDDEKLNNRKRKRGGK